MFRGNDITGRAMPVVATPELGIPFPFDTAPEELDGFREKAEALLKTVEVLESSGLSVEVTDEDRQQSHEAVIKEALPTPKNTTPGAVKHLNAILSEMDHEILDVHRRLRNYVTNKLVVETIDEDPKVRLKALELLGKVTGVGLFSERIDVSVSQRSVKDIENEIRKTLELFVEGECTPIADMPGTSLAEIDVDAELGVVDGPDPTT